MPAKHDPQRLAAIYRVSADDRLLVWPIEPTSGRLCKPVQFRPPRHPVTSVEQDAFTRVSGVFSCLIVEHRPHLAEQSPCPLQHLNLGTLDIDFDERWRIKYAEQIIKRNRGHHDAPTRTAR